MNTVQTGKGSCCSFQRDVLTGGSFHKPIKNPLPNAVIKVIKSLFDCFGKKEKNYFQLKNVEHKM